MKLRKKLQSPSALVLQGFVAGAIMFLTLEPLGPGEPPPTPAAGDSVLATLQV